MKIKKCHKLVCYLYNIENYGVQIRTCVKPCINTKMNTQSNKSKSKSMMKTIHEYE